MATELENLLAVFREVDRGLAADPRNTPAVAELLPPYTHGAATGWVDTVERWAATRRPAGTGLPDVETALDGLASSPPTPGMETRRVLALGALARARPEQYGPHGAGHERVLAALAPLEWDGSLDTHLLRVPDGGRLFGRVVLRADLPVPDLDRDQARRAVDVFLDPGSWPCLLPDLWAGMAPVDGAPADEPLLPGQTRTYEERFRVTDRLQLTPVLEFRRTHLLPDPSELAQALEYRLVEGEANEDDLVRRDSGALVAHFVDGILRIRTTKRVRFRPPFDGPGLVMFAGALGYLDASEQMVRTAIATTSSAGAPT